MKIPMPDSWKQAVQRRFARWSVIPMLHRVDRLDSGRLAENEGLKVSPELLEAFIVTAKRSGWSFISLDEMTAELGRGVVPRKTISMTLDDGYRDNLTIAAPIFRAHDVPYCVYVTTGLIDGSTSMWWYDLEAVIGSANILQGPDGSCFDCTTEKGKSEAFSQIKCLIMSSDSRIRETVKSWLSTTRSSAVDATCLADEVLTWPEVIELSKDSLATVGAHTVTHPVLLSLDDEDAEIEISNSKRILESQLGQQISHFAYPFGGDTAAGPREFEMARKAGYRSAVTTRSGRLAAAPVDLYSLPRLVFSESPDKGVVSALGPKAIVRAMAKHANPCRRSH